MRKLIYIIIFSFITLSVVASNQSTWKPKKKHRCGFKKFKCPAANNACIRRPRKSKCEVVKVKGGKKNKRTSYVDYCANANSQYKCIGSYSSCKQGEYSVSVGGTQNPYAECAP